MLRVQSTSAHSSPNDFTAPHSTRRSARLNASTPAYGPSNRATESTPIPRTTRRVSLRLQLPKTAASPAPQASAANDVSAFVNNPSWFELVPPSSHYIPKRDEASISYHQGSMTDAVDTGTRGSSWSVEDDETLILARAHGLNWNQISPVHFPSKSPNACRKRHERLMERQEAKKWEWKSEVLAQAYMEVRKEAWSILAARVGEKWTLVEQKCMEAGLLNLTRASRSAQKRQNYGINHGTDSGIGVSNLGDEPDPHNIPVASTTATLPAQYLYNRALPSIQSMLGPTQGHPSLGKSIGPNHRGGSHDRDQPHAPLTSPAIPASVVNSASSVDFGQITDNGHKTNFAESDHTSVLRSPVQGVDADIMFLGGNSVPQQLIIQDPQKDIGTSQALSSSYPVFQDVVHTHLGNLLSQRNNDSLSLSLSSVLQPQSGSMPSASNCSEGEAVDMSEESLEGSSTGCINDLDTQKEQILDRLMVYFYELFAVTTFSTRNGGESCETSGASQQIERSSGINSRSTRKKRKSNERTDDDEAEEDEVDKRGKRQRRSSSSTNLESTNGKRLACPYFKHDHRKHHPSGACSGPGWFTIPRLKGHLYRQHTMPLHCRRCYEIFKNEAQITEHSRLSDGCVMRDAKLIEGFDKDQEKKLKDRSTMFQAESEEHKWKIVYLILFPDTAPSELPTPYYDTEIETSSGQVESISPKAPELKQFDAFMNRELPREVRKALETAMERIIGPIEETLKNELESIVRNCHETLTKSFLDTARRLTSCPEGPSSSKESAFSMQAAFAVNKNVPISSDEGVATDNGLSQYMVPPESMLEPWPPEVINHSYSQPTWSDSAYFSHSEILGNSFLHDSSVHVEPPDTILVSADVEECNFALSTSSGNPVPATYARKGKGRAVESTSMLQYGV
ncbi:hypothetical protein GQ44DRAFT_809716 [Phaeosphaeriaceae sp. PMI808]|nr:hypothetical protein GQ44DRAFT_809716 [Phaeosphaeriaceae sp. PMI808]